MKLLDLYKSLLKTAHLVVTEDGCVSRSFAGRTEPVLIGGKRLVLPTREHLANSNTKERLVFHPLNENFLKGESIILEHFRKSLNTRLNFTIGLLAYQLLSIAASPAEHAKLNPDQSEFLSKVKNADEKTLEVFRKIMKAMGQDQTQRSFVSLYLKRGGELHGVKHARIGVVVFPFYKELAKEGTKEGHEVYGVKLRVKDREALMALMAYMIPGISVPEKHNRASDSDVAPFLDALMKAVLAVAAPLNDLIELFKNQLEDPSTVEGEEGTGAETLLFEDTWVEAFDNLSLMIPEIRSIPMQAGNEGQPSKLASEPPPPVSTAPIPGVTPPHHQSTLHMPPQAPAPAAPQPGWTPAPAYMPPQPTPAPVAWVPPPAPVVTPWGAPAPHPGAGIVRTANGIDFDSLVRTNPALGGPRQYIPPAQAQSIPRWAQTQGYPQGPQQYPASPGWNQPQQPQYAGWTPQNAPGMTI